MPDTPDPGTQAAPPQNPGTTHASQTTAATPQHMVATTTSDPKHLHTPGAKVPAQEIWDGTPDELHKKEFVWDLRLSGGHAIAQAIWEDRMTLTDALANNMLTSYTHWNTEIFSFLINRISDTTEEGKQLMRDVMLAVQERSLARNDGIGLKKFFRNTVVFKTSPEVDDANTLLDSVRLTLGMNELRVKQLGTVVGGLLFRMPAHSRGHTLRAYKIMLEALPPECEVQRTMLEHQLGINNLFTTATAPPPWSVFTTHVAAALAAATRKTDAKSSLSSHTALAAFLPPSEKVLLANTPSLPGQYGAPTRGGDTNGFKGKCFNCGGEHLARDCDQPPCDECGKMYCGSLRGVDCMITHGIPSDAKGIDGKPLRPEIKQRIERVRAAKSRDGNKAESSNLALGSNTLLVEDDAIALVATHNDSFRIEMDIDIDTSIAA